MRKNSRKKQRGVALIVTITTIAILSIMLADMHDNAATHYAISVQQLAKLQAEYMARSGLNLTRLLISQRKSINARVNPIFQLYLKTKETISFPLWQYANYILQPFCSFEETQASSNAFANIKGLGNIDGVCKIKAFAENSKININSPSLGTNEKASKEFIAMNLYSMMGGQQNPNPYNQLFEKLDRDNQITDRQNIIASIIDWWDQDSTKTIFDPIRLEISESGSEDNLYQTLDDPYNIKNAPFNSIEELRLIRGIGDDIWDTFIHPDPREPTSRTLTIYGTHKINVNEANPEIILAALCSIVKEYSVCLDPIKMKELIFSIRLLKKIAPILLFPSERHFIEFMMHDKKSSLFNLLKTVIGPNNLMSFPPVQFKDQKEKKQAISLFTTKANVINIEVQGLAKCKQKEDSSNICIDWYATTNIKSVVNFDQKWSPPPSNSGTIPSLGVFYYYRIE